MDPFTIGIAVAGLATSVAGMFGASSDAHQAAQINKGIASDEQSINDQKRTQMEMEARRQSLQNMRNAQRARAQSVAVATNQGANKGSGLAGGLAQITGEENFNALGINNNLDIGENIFNYTNDISGKKMQLADVQSDQATNTALMSLGGSMVSNAQTIGNVGKFVGGKLTSTV